MDKYGRPVTGWFKEGDLKYYFNSDGVMVSARWMEIEGKWYYFYEDGSLATNTKIDGYQIDENGVRKAK